MATPKLLYNHDYNGNPALNHRRCISIWEEQYIQLIEYKTVHGHTNVPIMDGTLGEWVHFQRRQHRKLILGETSYMNIGQKKALDLIGFCWSYNLKDDEKEVDNMEQEEIGGSNQQGDQDQTTKTAVLLDTPILLINDPTIQDVHRIILPDDDDIIEIKTLVKISWEERFMELSQYKLRNGNCNVPFKWQTNPSLADWVRKQRVQCKLYQNREPSQLTAGKIKKLADIGFDFDYNDDSRENGEDTENLQKLYDENEYAIINNENDDEINTYNINNSNIVMETTVTKSPKAKKVTTQKRKRTPKSTKIINNANHDENDDNNIDNSNVETETTVTKKPKAKKVTARKRQSTPKSTEKGISKFDAKWQQCFSRLVAFKEMNGDCNVPRYWKVYPSLGEWVTYQRKHYRLKQLGRKHCMTDERLEKLESIGFEWSLRGSNYDDAIDVDESIMLKGYDDGMNEDEKAQAGDATRKMSVKETQWLENFSKLIAFKEMYGSCHVSTRHPKFPKLGEWVKSQRKQYRLKQLGQVNYITDERIQKLESIGFEWSVQKSSNKSSDACDQQQDAD